ncbi:MerC domain-containing protein [Aquimarina muelleri]|uniref:MerC mercury resistance protein n=1 Tax=Aquimarina muelleri TaxID=279356 RepID=A0A918JZH6_9FLAO|nr:hypothetical protein GCM10007384_39080 [Aquimarina muelleri]
MIYNTDRINWDFIGLSASFLCVLHCMILPICIPFFPLIGLSFINNEFHEILLITVSLIIAFIALYNGYKRFHNKLLPVFIYIFTLVFFSTGFLIENHFIERILHFFATGFLIIAHYYNWKFIKAYKKCKIKKT